MTKKDGIRKMSAHLKESSSSLQKATLIMNEIGFINASEAMNEMVKEIEKSILIADNLTDLK
jgi:Zn-dependent peptidase ImmA (M78 family)